VGREGGGERGTVVCVETESGCATEGGAQSLRLKLLYAFAYYQHAHKVNAKCAPKSSVCVRLSQESLKALVTRPVISIHAHFTLSDNQVHT
jgi:hypothetical protein